MNKKGDIVWDKLGNIILLVILLIVLILIIGFLTGSIQGIWDKIVRFMRFGG